MPNLQNLSRRIKSVKSTRKVTSAMKVISAAKLTKSKILLDNSAKYTEELSRLIKPLILAKSESEFENCDIVFGRKTHNKVHLSIIISSERGLCGGINTQVAKRFRLHFEKLTKDGKVVKVLVIGKKAFEQIKTHFGQYIISKESVIADKKISMKEVEKIAGNIINSFNKGEFDEADVIYTKFISPISQVATIEKLIPFVEFASPKNHVEENSLVKYESDMSVLIPNLLVDIISAKLYNKSIESSTSEHAARMYAMDNATRNAGDLVKKLSIIYNRSRQANITKELIDIISGANSVDAR